MQHDFPEDINLEPYRYGWESRVPLSRGGFIGHEITIKFETSSLPTEKAPLPLPEEVELCKIILTNLNQILQDAEATFLAYNEECHPEARDHVSNPHIWIAREFIESGFRWAFVIEQDDSPDFGYHIEFDGQQCLGLSAGD